MYFPDLIEEYKQSLKDLRESGGCLSMQRDLMEAIKWMETGYDPAEYRAATRTDAIPIDPYHMQTFMAYVNDDLLMPQHFQLERELVKEGKILENNYIREMERVENVKTEINVALQGLTKDERAVFIAIKAERIPFSKVAHMMGISKSTVQSYLERAERKIKNNLTNGVQPDLFDRT
ncbi:sigma factor-like helix-turn-helix DNA-binding protein [Lysinibacillus sp. KU-BSD001]|uniref:sigma factor-like helix-turn-helix DNA-binding protein n=1 Tax=Lysinibacillus sp. KU-BSD001 TaxID=3141328 RepID=UPI0036E50BBE